MLLRVENLGKSFGINEIFQQVNFMLEDGDKVGLIGANGMGKTTLVKCLMGELTADTGKVFIKPHARVSYLEQAAPTPQGTLWQVLFGAQERIVILRVRLETLTAQVAQTVGEAQQEYLTAYQRALEEYEHLGGYEYEATVRRVAFGLGFSQGDFQRQVGEFSGGQKTRINLAAALVRQPDLLILDEPTNHLDIQMIEWLEEYLRNYSGGVLVISHDRYFLDKITNKIFHLHNTRLQTYKGNFSAYLRQYELEFASKTAAYEKQQEHIQATEEYIRRYRAGIKSKQARGRQSQLDRLTRLDKPAEARSIHLQLPPAGMCGQNVLTLERVTIGYDKPLIENVNFTVRRGDRVAIVGPNGSGKTSMLKSILGERKIMNGRIQPGERVHIGYFSQEHEGLNFNNTLLEEVQQASGESEEQCRTMLGSLLFRGDDVFKLIGSLSGGERARIALLKLMLQGANFLIMDEPTNHLDVLAREVLEETLADFDGTLLMVSHDRYFLDKVADKVWEIENRSITEYLGNYSAYKEKKTELLRLQAEAAEEALEFYTPAKEKEKGLPEQIPVKEQSLRRKSYTLRDLERIELQIREREAMLKMLEVQMNAPSNQEDFQLIGQLAEEHQSLEQELIRLMEEWEQAMSDVEE